MALEDTFFVASARGRVCIIWNNRKDLALLTSRERERERVSGCVNISLCLGFLGVIIVYVGDCTMGRVLIHAYVPCSTGYP